MPKGFQNGAKIDAKTHKRSMPTLVSEKIRKIMKTHVSLKGKLTECTCFCLHLQWSTKEQSVETFGIEGAVASLLKEGSVPWHEI